MAAGKMLETKRTAPHAGRNRREPGEPAAGVYGADTARQSSPPDESPADRAEIGFDEGKTTEIDFDKPAPRDEGDNPAEQEAARRIREKRLPPRARPSDE